MRRSEPVTKDEVVAAAAALFDERGFHGTRADDIAEALQIAKPTLYSRTEGKGELLEAIMEQVEEVIRRWETDAERMAAEGLAPLPTLRRLYSQHVADAVRYQAYFNVMFMEERQLPAERRERVRAWGERFTRRVQGLVEAGVADGSIHDALDPKVTAHTILASANWVCTWYRADGALSADDVAERSWALLERGLRAPRRRAGRDS